MSKLHRLFHLTRVTEYLPPAEPIHRGKCFGKIGSYHWFLSAVGLKGRGRTAAKAREDVPTRHTAHVLPGICIPLAPLIEQECSYRFQP